MTINIWTLENYASQFMKKSREQMFDVILVEIDLVVFSYRPTICKKLVWLKGSQNKYFQQDSKLDFFSIRNYYTLYEYYSMFEKVMNTWNKNQKFGAIRTMWKKKLVQSVGLGFGTCNRSELNETFEYSLRAPNALKPNCSKKIPRKQFVGGKPRKIWHFICFFSPLSY